MKTLPVIGRYSNEQIRFTRRTNYKRSDFEQDMPRATLADVKFALAIIAIIVIASIGLRAAA